MRLAAGHRASIAPPGRMPEGRRRSREGRAGYCSTPGATRLPIALRSGARAGRHLLGSVRWPQHQTPPEQLLTPAEVAALVFVDPKTVSRWARAGKIPFTRTPGGHRRFRSVRRRGASCPRTGLRTRSQPSPSASGPWAACDAAATAADAVVAEAVAIALEAQAEAAAEAVLDSAAAVAAAAEKAASAAVKAASRPSVRRRRGRPGGRRRGSDAAAAMRSRATVQAGCLAEAAAQAKRSFCAAGDRSACHLRRGDHGGDGSAAADAASADTALAAARVAQAVTDAAAHVAVMVAAFDLTLERETAAAAEALHHLTVETARHLAQTNAAVARRASPPRSVRT